MKIFNSKQILLAGTLLAGTALSANALVVYGKTNADAAVNYSDENAGSFLYSVVKVGGNGQGSANYLGNGWFLTADRVSVGVGTLISQNGKSAKVSSVNTVLKTKYGVDLKLFHCDDVSALTYLTSAKLLAADAFPTLSKPLGVESSIDSAGTQITYVGAGCGRDASSDRNLTSATATASTNYCVVRTGTAEIILPSNAFENSATNYFATWATQTAGSTQAGRGDSGGGAFANIGGVDYLIGVMTNVGNFVDDKNPSNIYFGERDLSKRDYSLTLSVNLKDYVGTIESIIAAPEPSAFAWFAGTFALFLAGTRRRRRK